MRSNICRSYPILIIGMFLLTCKKNNTSPSPLILQSTVYDIKSKIPKAGVKVYLFESPSNSALIFGVNWHEDDHDPFRLEIALDSTITNNNGQFNFLFYPRLNDQYITGPKYIISDSLFRVYNKTIERSDQDKDSIYVDSKKYLTVNMQKLNPVFADDSIIQSITILQPWDLYEFGHYRTFIGSPPTRKLFYSYPTCNKVLVDWKYYHPNLQGWGKDTFDLLPNGTNVTIYY